MRGRYVPKYTEDTFWTYWRLNGECWEWTGARNVDGYGICTSLGERTAHRTAWVLAHGSIPFRMHVLHHCDNPPCINPAHLFLGTHQDNMADKTSKGRAYLSTGGTRNRHSKLTEEQVAEIKAKYQPRRYGCLKLSREFGVSYQHIHRIITGQRWVDHSITARGR